MISQDKLLPVNIVAVRLGVSRKTVWRLIRYGKIAAVDYSTGGLSPRYKIAESELARFLSERQT